MDTVKGYLQLLKYHGSKHINYVYISTKTSATKIPFKDI